MIPPHTSGEQQSNGLQKIPLDMSRYTKPTTDAPHELAAAVNLIEEAGLFTEAYNRIYWSAAVKRANYDHPEEQVRLLLKKLKDLEAYLWGKKSQVMSSKGGWLTNRLKEQAAGPQPRN